MTSRADRRDRAERFVSRAEDVTVHLPAGTPPIPGLPRQTTDDDPAERARRRRRRARPGLGLGTLREHRGVTQTALADRLGMQQGAVSVLEGREDHRLSTVARYVHALDHGATVSLLVQYADGTTDTVTVPVTDDA